jgi:hypothetical protein
VFNVLPELKTPKVFYAIIAMIVFLIIILICFLCKVPNPFNKSSISKSQEEIVGEVFIVLFFTLLVFTLCIATLPSLKELKTLFLQISNVSYLIIYTIFLILFFTMMSKDTINSYAYIIAPITAITSIFFLFKGFSQNYVSDFNVNYERIKTMIMFFCMITIFIIYYNIDPGGYIQKYFGYTLLLTIITSVFAFLYLLIVIGLPDKTAQSEKGATYSNFLNNFSNISTYGTILFFIFIASITVVISTYPGGFFNDKATSAASMIILLLICVVWGIMIGAMQFPELSNNMFVNDKMNLFKRALLFLFGIVISGLIIFWLVYNIHGLSSKSGIISFVLNLLLVIIVLGLIYKTLIVRLPTASGNSKKNAFFTMIINIIFYIPCFFNGIFDTIGKFLVGEYNSTTMGSVLMLIIAVASLVSYLEFPHITHLLSVQGGKELVNNPVNIDSQHSLGNAEELNGKEKFDYQYGISFWVFIDSAPPNTNESYTKYTSLLNFGNKPNVLYNAKDNTLMVTMQQKDQSKNTENKLTDFDDNGNRILYTKNNVLLQKWNHFIINYNGGVLDIFLNGELVKSDIGVVPYYTIDNLTIGQDNGIKGGICNVVYFSHPLTASNIYYLYNTVKDKTPPVSNDSNTTILKGN